MSKPFEIITYEDWDQLLKDTGNCITRGDINKLITEKGQVGYTLWRKNSTYGTPRPEHLSNVTYGIQSERSDQDNTEYLCFRRPIEEEKPNCEHELKRTKMTRNPQTDGSVIIAHCDIKNKHCPKCGVALK